MLVNSIRMANDHKVRKIQLFFLTCSKTDFNQTTDALEAARLSLAICTLPNAPQSLITDDTIESMFFAAQSNLHAKLCKTRN